MSSLVEKRDAVLEFVLPHVPQALLSGLPAAGGAWNGFNGVILCAEGLYGVARTGVSQLVSAWTAGRKHLSPDYSESEGEAKHRVVADHASTLHGIGFSMVTIGAALAGAGYLNLREAFLSYHTGHWGGLVAAAAVSSGVNLAANLLFQPVGLIAEFNQSSMQTALAGVEKKFARPAQPEAAPVSARSQERD